MRDADIDDFLERLLNQIDQKVQLRVLAKVIRLAAVADDLLPACEALVALLAPAGMGPPRLPDTDDTRNALAAVAKAVAASKRGTPS